MTVKEAYNQFLLMINRNNTGSGVAVDLVRFLMLFNTAQDKFFEYVLNKRNEDFIRYAQAILVDDKPLKKIGTHLDHIDFELPDDYFDFSNAHATATNSSCSGRIKLWEIKNENREEILYDEFNKPSFTHREAPYILSSNKLKIFTDGFDLSNVELSYYRCPQRVDCDNILGNGDVDPEFNPKIINRILEIAAKDYGYNVENNRYNLDSNEVLSDI